MQEIKIINGEMGENRCGQRPGKYHKSAEKIADSPGHQAPDQKGPFSPVMQKTKDEGTQMDSDQL